MVHMSMTAAVVSSMDVVFSPLFSLPPILSVIFFSALLSAITLGLTKLLTKKEVMKEMKEKMKALNDTMKRAQKEGNKDLMDQSTKELFSMNGSYMKESMKLMVASLGVGIVFLMYMSAKYVGENAIVSLPLFGISLNWVYWYVITSMAITLVMRKVTGEI